MAEQPELILHRWVIMLDKTGWRATKSVHYVRFTGKSYIRIDKVRVPAEKLMVANSRYWDDHNNQCYYTYCFPEYDEAALELLRKRVETRVKLIASQVQLLVNKFDQFDEIEIKIIDDELS